MSSLSDPPVKRKRGRPPKKQPLDVYMSFTSQFQALSPSSSPSAESNSNLMVKLGEPNSFTPVMKVAPSKPVGKRCRKSMGVSGSSSSVGKLRSPGSLSGSCSPSIKKIDIEIPTPLTVRSHVSPNSAVNLKLDDKVYDNMQKIIGLSPKSNQAPCQYERSMSAYELPLASPQLTPRLSLSSAHSDLEVYCQALKQSPVKGHRNVAVGLDDSPEIEITKSMMCPETDQSFYQEEDAFSFNLIIDGRGRAALSLDMPDESVHHTHPQETPYSNCQEPKSSAGVITDFSFSNGYSPAGHFGSPHTSLNKIDRVIGSEIFHDISEVVLDSKLRLTPIFNSFTDCMLDTNSPLQPLMPELYLDSDTVFSKQHSVKNSMNNAKNYSADPFNLYKTINMNSLPCFEGGDARAALKRVFQKQ